MEARPWKNRYKNLYKRDVFEKLERNLQTKHIQVIQGIRRSGKSTLFKLLINHLSQTIDPKEILYINLDDPFLHPLEMILQNFMTSYRRLKN